MRSETRQYLNLSDEVFRQALAARSQYNALLGEVLKRRSQVEIVYESAEVFRSPYAYQAMFEHSTKQLALNRFFIDAAPEPSLVETFLIVHELFHALAGKASHEPHSEALADCLAILAVTTPQQESERAHDSV